MTVPTAPTAPTPSGATAPGEVAVVWSLDIDVTDVLPDAGPLHTQVTVHLPPVPLLPERPVVVFAFPGGGAGRGMWCMEAPDTLAYSQARWHAERGVVVVSCDHLGTGGSSHPDPALLTSPYPVAWANEATVRGVLALLRDDGVLPGYGAVVDPVVIAMGHSMGGNLTILLQAHREVFDGVAILGYSGIQTALPHPPGMDPRPPRRPPRMHPPDGRDTEAEMPSEEWRAVLRHINYWDEAEAAEMRRHDWVLPRGSRTMPLAARNMNAAGVVAEEASWITVPVFVGFGERDVTRNPWEEPRWYWRSRDVTLCVVPRMSHGMNSASTRERMWERLQHWFEGVAAFRHRD